MDARFGQAPQVVQDAVNKIEDVDVLDGLLRKAVTAGSLEEFERELTL